jgi:fructokinase
VLLDPNCRPSAVADHEAYRRRIGVIARRADIVKASTEDLAYLYPDVPPEEAAKALLDGGPSLVLVTDGPRPARAFLPGSILAEEVLSVTVVDTIGAGDTFGGGFLAWWTAHGLGQADLGRPAPARPAPARPAPARPAPARDALVGKALRAAVAAAALTCTRPGADPPTLAELQARNWWP